MFPHLSYRCALHAGWCTVNVGCVRSELATSIVSILEDRTNQNSTPFFSYFQIISYHISGYIMLAFASHVNLFSRHFLSISFFFFFLNYPAPPEISPFPPPAPLPICQLARSWSAGGWTAPRAGYRKCPAKPRRPLQGPPLPFSPPSPGLKSW